MYCQPYVALAKDFLVLLARMELVPALALDFQFSVMCYRYLFLFLISQVSQVSALEELFQIQVLEFSVNLGLL